jgi:galactonate dehydratase
MDVAEEDDVNYGHQNDYCRKPLENWVFVKVYTDEGITGVGEATGGLSTKLGEAQVHELCRFVTGEDPLHPEYLWNKMYKGLFVDRNVGMNAIEIAWADSHLL